MTGMCSTTHAASAFAAMHLALDAQIVLADWH